VDRVTRIDSNSVEVILRDLATQTDSIAVDLTACHEITLTGLVYLAIAAYDFRMRTHLRESVTLRVPRRIAPLSYIAASGIVSLFSPAGLMPFEIGHTSSMALESAGGARSAAGTFPMPVRLVSKPDYQHAEFEAECKSVLDHVALNIVPELVRRYGYDSQDAKRFWEPSRELIFNIYEHSRSWGFGAIEARTTGLTITYADLGVGIPDTMRPKLRRTPPGMSSVSDSFAIMRAFEWGTTGIHNSGARGTGLAEVLRFANRHDGAVECRSGDVKIRYAAAKAPAVRTVTRLPGAQVSIFLPRRSLG